MRRRFLPPVEWTLALLLVNGLVAVWAIGADAPAGTNIVTPPGYYFGAPALYSTNATPMEMTGDPRYALLGSFTNRVTNIIRSISASPVEGKCPECSEPNHHDRRVEYVCAYDMVYVNLRTAFGTNQTLVACGATNYWVATNVALRGRTPLGPPPLPR